MNGLDKEKLPVASFPCPGVKANPVLGTTNRFFACFFVKKDKNEGMYRSTQIDA